MARTPSLSSIGGMQSEFPEHRWAPSSGVHSRCLHFWALGWLVQDQQLDSGEQSDSWNCTQTLPKVVLAIDVFLTPPDGGGRQLALPEAHSSSVHGFKSSNQCPRLFLNNGIFLFGCPRYPHFGNRSKPSLLQSTKCVFSFLCGSQG